MSAPLAAALSHWSVSERRVPDCPAVEGSPEALELVARWLIEADRRRREHRAAGHGRFHPGEPGSFEILSREGRRIRVEVHGSPPLDLQVDGDRVVLVPCPRRPPRRAFLKRLAKATGLDLDAAERLFGAGDHHPCDRWTDADLADILDTSLAHILGRAVLDGVERPLVDEALEIARRVRPGLLPPPALAVGDLPPDRLVLPRNLLPDDLARHLPPLVDTATLSADQAARVREHAPPWTVLLLLGHVHQAVEHVLAESIAVHAVLEDPPYASSSDDLAYRDAWPTGAWASLMREHLHDLRRLLPADGKAVLHIDEHRGAALETLAQDIFGEDMLGMGVWDKRNPKGDAIGLAAQHERLLWLCGDRGTLRASGGLSRTKQGAQRLLRRAAQLLAEHDLDTARPLYRRWVREQTDLSAGVRAYQHLDETGQPYRPVSMAWPSKRTPPDAYFVPLLHPVTGEPCPVPRRGWRNPPDTMARLRSEGRILFGADHSTQPTRKYLLAEQRRENVPSVLAHAGSDDALQAHMGLPFPYAKPLAMNRLLLDIVAPTEGLTVFDGFAGSGSTAHAVLDDSIPRRAILAERSEEVARTTLLPRLLRVMASDVWRDGEPVGETRHAVLRIRVLDTRLTGVQTHL